jgi:thiol:disulfide interchange protein
MKSFAVLFLILFTFCGFCNPGSEKLPGEIISSAQSQVLNPVEWEYSTKKISDCEYELILKATIQKGWHLYSQFLPGDDGPLPTTFDFKKHSAYSLIGKTQESKPISKFEPVFNMDLKFFENTATFTQKVKSNSSKPFIVKGELNFMVCNDTECKPPVTKELEFNITDPGNCGDTKTAVNVKTDTTHIASKDSLKDTTAAVVAAIDTSAFSENPTDIKLEEGCSIAEITQDDFSFWGIFLGGFIGGLLALLTPCVFPMIPLTVSFFTKESKNRHRGFINAVIYAISIILIYVTLGFLITISFGSDALNDMASNVYFNLAFFVIFIVFAFSFFGAFEITIPHKFVSKADQASERGGLIGIFFMAFTLSLVSFSCTGPIIGTLLVQAARGDSYLGPLLGMTGFSVALALPFALFAAFPGWLNSLPKSGGWLNTVKVTLGFIELALALKFLSNVDLAYHWGILHRETFLALWIIIFGLLGFYLLGKLKFSHDSEMKHIPIPRFFMAILSLTFTLYLIPGLWGAPTKMVSGYLPPLFYREWIVNGNECPHNLNCFHDYEEGMKYARQQGKPVMIDFTGWSCVNCRKMEDNVWSDTKVMKRLSEDYVLISLYVDDKKELPESMQYTNSAGNKIKTQGNKWSELQAIKYKTNSQPYYVLLDNQGKILAQPRGYTPQVDTYLSFLDEGLCRYKKRTVK